VELWIAGLDAWVVTLIFALTMVAFFVLGSWRGRRSPSPAGDTGEKYTDASMALLGLLLAFTFSMALNRYDNRHQAMVAETSAIGDLYTNATLLPEPTRSEFQTLLSNYVARRLEGRREGALRNEQDRVLLEARQMQAKATDIVSIMVEQQTPTTVPLVNTLNAVGSTYLAYLAAYRERLPAIVLILLLVGSAIPAFLMGRQGATNTVHKSGPLAFCLLVTLVIYVTFDLNQPSGGLITVRDEPLVELLKSLSN
jgi:hypothetical protein